MTTLRERQNYLLQGLGIVMILPSLWDLLNDAFVLMSLKTLMVVLGIVIFLIGVFRKEDNHES